MKKTTNEAKTVAWLMTRNRRTGIRRIEVLGWKRLSHIYDAFRPGSLVRKAINREALRCGYTPSTILALNY